MLCEKCKKNQATVFYQENINGQKRSYSLCTECAAATEKENGLSMGGGFTHELFGTPLFGGLFGHAAAPVKTKACPACGASLGDFRQNGRMGCPDCYAAFSEELEGTVRSIHGNVRHVGRAPARYRKDREKQDRIADLRGQLKQAVDTENFELAATLRDELRALEEDQ